MKSISITRIKEILNDSGLKATHPRLVVFSELIKHNIHPTADQLYDHLKIDHPSIAKGTVYRILDHLVSAGLVNQVSTKQGIRRYDANLDQHAHIYCIKTHEIQDYYNDELDSLIRDFFARKKVENFHIREIKLQINGEKEDPNKKVTIV